MNNEDLIIQNKLLEEENKNLKQQPKLQTKEDETKKTKIKYNDDKKLKESQ